MIIENQSIPETMQQLALAPFNNPEILPSLLPIILGAIVIELYFGKHERESLGWNTSVGNSVIWVATGINLLISGAIKSSLERYVSYFLIATGVFIGYMDFFHKWSPQVAFRISSADIIYPLAYVAVVIVRTRIPVNDTTIKAAGAFIVTAFIGFRILRMLETPTRDDFNFR